MAMGRERANRAKLRGRIARRVPSRRRRCVGFVDQRRADCTIVAGDGVAILQVHRAPWTVRHCALCGPRSRKESVAVRCAAECG